MNPEQILKQADSCVKCGLCLPHCPTYRLSADEAESPRGRISLVQGLLTESLQDSPKLHAHLDRCLGCGACEAMCPSLVPYTQILDGARAYRAQRLSPARRRLRLAFLQAILHPGPLTALLRLYRRSGLQKILRAAGLARFIPNERLAVDIPKPPAPLEAKRGAPGKTAMIFPGCVGRHMDAGAQAAAVRVLGLMGIKAGIPAESMCCGALHRHEGFPRRAERERDAGLRILRAAGPDMILTLASACQASLREHPDPAIPVHEITRFLADLDWPRDLRPKPLAAKVLVHVPCTQRNQLRDPGAAPDLLRRIPGLEPAELPDETCCGAAGAYILSQPELSLRLLEGTLAQLRDRQAVLLVTTNTGCALQLKSGIEAAGLGIEVLHPVELLARQLTDED